jgi:phosphatidylserine/phosphatidylglycerophosphate/cardiolipin synthase-like enzyme
LCVGREWVGYPDKGIPPWRDTGVELQGPAVADVAQAFARAIRGEMGYDRIINVVKAGTLKH